MSDQEYCSDVNFSDDENMDYSYYNIVEDCEPDPEKTHPEFFEYECLTVKQVEAFLNESVETVSKALQVTPSLAKVVLHSHCWKTEDIISKYSSDSSSLLVDFKIKQYQPTQAPECQICSIRLSSHTSNRLRGLACEHLFCEDCWVTYFEIQITEGKGINIKCMAQECEMLAPEDFVLSALSRPSIRDKYQQFVFRDYVKSHPQLAICPGPNCEIVIRAKKPSPKRVICNVCTATFCFVCGSEYHAPTDCSSIRKWLIKCFDDAETANYINTHTKCCPECHVSIEKSGGCNHMLCYNCEYEFCWMCMKNWKTHNWEMYMCSYYMRDPNTADEFVQAQAREAVQKYLHYFQRWQNHSNSLKLAEQILQMIRSHIDKKIMDGSGTWIDWHPLLDAANLLFKSRHTLQYTYPYAYYMEPGPHKELFEYQQSQIELQVEGLAWKIERAESTDISDLVNQMNIVEKWRTALLKDFFKA